MKTDSSVHHQVGDLAGIVPSVNLEAEPGRMDFYERARGRHLAPLWRVLHGLVTAKPHRDACLRYGAMRTCGRTSWRRAS